MKLLKHFKLAAGGLLMAGLAACGGGDWRRFGVAKRYLALSAHRCIIVRI